MKKTFIAFLFAANSLAAHAQEKNLSLDEVSVTATKFPKKSSETGKVVSVISKEEIDRSGGKNLLELLNNQPALNLNGANSNRGSNISPYLRGASSGYVQILIDGIPINDPSNMSSNYDLNLIDLSMVDHIEILKGGHSTLYGSDAVAGVINIITRKGGNKPLGVSALLTAGSYKSYKQSLGLNGSLKKVDYNLSLSNEKTGGFSSATDSLGNAKFDNDDFRLKSVNFNAGWQAKSNLLIRPFIRYNETKSMADYDSFIDDKDYNVTSSELASGFTSNLQVKSLALFMNYSYNKVKKNFLNDRKFGPDEYSLSDMSGQLHNAELYGKYDISKHFELLAGTSYRFTNSNQVNKYISPYWSSASKMDDDSTKSEIGSAYASVFLKNLNGFNLEMGGRFNHHSTYGNNFTYTINPSFLVDETLKLFVNISSAFKAPSLYQLYDPMYGNLSLKPERVQSYEAGFQTVFSEGKVKFGINAFKRKGKDVISFTNHYVNYNKQDDTGMEVEGTFLPYNGLTLKTYYALVYGKVYTQNEVNNNLLRRPRNTFGFNAGYKVNRDIFISTNLKVVGESMDRYYDPNSFQTVNLKLNKYFLIDVYAEYKLFEKLKLFVDLKNITNEHYFEITGYNTRNFNFNTGLSLSL